MARRGTFGRLPRVAPSLTGTIIAAAQQMAAAQDRNIMSAWRNGGTFEGKAVTDDILLNHFRGRMRNLDKDDPTYDSYKLEVDQLDYSIHESRQSTLYAQGKISDRQMGQFYLNWAKKVPKDSEFYRQLQRDGARFIQVVRSNSRASGKASGDKAFSEGQANTAKGVASGDLITRVLTNLAVVNGLLDPTDTKGLAHLSDPTQFQNLIDRMNSNPDEALYVEGGQVITGNDVFAALKEIDPAFQSPAAGTGAAVAFPGARMRGGGLTSEYIIRAWTGAHETNLILAQREFAAGHKGSWKGGKGGNAYIKEAGLIAESVRDVGLWGISPAYTMIIKTRDTVLDDPTATNVEKYNALTQAANRLYSLAGTPGLDARTILTLDNESNANAGFLTGGTVSTFGQDYLGIGVPVGRFEAATSSDDTNDPKGNTRLSTLAAVLKGEIETVNEQPFDPSTGVGYMTTFGTRDPVTGVFEYDPKGQEVGVVNGVDVTRSASEGAAAIIIPQSGAAPLVAWGVRREVVAIARDANGMPFGNTGQVNEDGTVTDLPSVIGHVVTYNIGGQVTRLYETPDGLVHDISPWGGEVAGYDQPDGSILVDVSALVGEGAPGVARSWKTDADGNRVEGELVYNPQTVAISNITTAAGYDSKHQFNTYLIASLSVSPDARAAAKAFIQDPVAREYLAQQQFAAAAAGGGTEEEVLARLTNLQGMDSNLIARTVGGTRAAFLAGGGVHGVRTDRFGVPEVKTPPTAPTFPGVNQQGVNLRQLQPGARPTIQLGGQIKVPQAPEFRPSPSGQVAGPGVPAMYQPPSSLVQPSALQPRTPSTAAPAAVSTSTATPPPVTAAPKSTMVGGTLVQPGPVVARPLVAPVYRLHEQQIDPRTGLPYGGGR